MRASQAGSGHRGFPITGVTGDQAVSGGKPAVLRRIVVGVPAAGNVVVKDGATTKATLTCVTGQPFFVNFDLECTTSLVVAPSVTGLNLCVIYD